MTPAGTGARISAVDLSLLINTHGPVRPPHCPVCKGDMTIASVENGVVTYVCELAAINVMRSGAPKDVRDADQRHYRRSQTPIDATPFCGGNFCTNESA